MRVIFLFGVITFQYQTIFIDIECYDNKSIIEIRNNRIVIGGWQILGIINVDKCIIEQKLENKWVNEVYSLMILRDGNVLCGCSNGLICIYDIKSNNIIISKDSIHDGVISDLLSINEHQFVSCSRDASIKVWEY